MARVAIGLAVMGAVALAMATGLQLEPPVVEAIDRPALLVRSPLRSVMLGAARAGRRLVAVGERGVVLLSDDDGQHWRQASVPVSVTLTAVRFADAGHGFATGHGGVILSTADGGSTWHKVLDGQAAARLVKAASASDDRAMKSADRLLSEGPDKPFLDLAVLDARHVVVVGAYGLAFRSQDGGESWQAFGANLPNPKGLHLNAVRARGDSLWIAGEQGFVVHSSDGGRTFQVVAAGYAGSWFTAELPTDGEVVLAGLRGHVRRSTDDGATWTTVEVPAPASIIASSLDKDGRVLLAAQSGTAYVEQRGQVEPTGLQVPPLNALVSLDASHVLALTMQGLLTAPMASTFPGAAR